MRVASARSALWLAVILAVGGSPALAQPPGGNDAVVLLYNQLSDMQEELATLRAMVEEQAFEIQRLQRDTRDRYTDLDARISALYEDLPARSNAAPVTGAAPAGAQGANAARTPVNAAEVPVSDQQEGLDESPDNPDRLPDPASMTEQQFYQYGLDMLLQNEEYRLSTQVFDRYLDEYPDGRFVTNAWYWKGQALVNLSMLEEARQAFEVIVNDYPDGRKIEDAMYSLGTVYGELGNEQRARELLEQVMARFPNTSAANLADIYLRSLN